MPNQPLKNKKKKRILVAILLVVLVVFLALILWRTNFFRDRLDISPDNLFPFGTPSERTPDTRTPDEGGETPETIRPDSFIPLTRPRLRQITDFPVSGYVPLYTNYFFYSQAGMETYNDSRGTLPLQDIEVIRHPRLRVSHQDNGNITDIYVDQILTDRSVSETFIPENYHSYFSADGNRMLAQRYDFNNATIETFIGQLGRYESNPCEIKPDYRVTINNNHPSYYGLMRALVFTLNQNDVGQEIETLVTPANTSELLIDYIERYSLENETWATSTAITEELVAHVNRNCLNVFEGEDPVAISGWFNLAELDFLAMNPSGQTYFGLYQRGDLYTGSLFSSGNQNYSERIFASELSEWLPSWPNDETIFLQTKPSYVADGHLYSLQTDTGRLDKVLGPEIGLNTLVSPDTSHVLYSLSISENGARSTRLLNLATREITQLPFTTIPDKCAWSADSKRLFCGVPKLPLQPQEPDSWYKGITETNDVIWMVILKDSGGVESRRLVDPTIINLSVLDIYRMQVDPFDHNFIYFMDKKTNFVWQYEVDGLDDREEDEVLDLDLENSNDDEV